MTYAAVTKSNILYQPRENIKTLITNNLTNSTEIYSYFPNQKKLNFKGYPFIVIPDLETPINEEFFSSNVKEFLNEVEGSLFHEVKSLGDNKLRTLKQNIFQALNLKSNERILNALKMHDIKIEMGNSSSEPILADQNEIIEIPFIISFNVEVDFT